VAGEFHFTAVISIFVHYYLSEECIGSFNFWHNTDKHFLPSRFSGEQSYFVA
jgi:hypothetical protein